MPLATASTADRSGHALPRVATVSALLRLRRLVEKQRERRVDRMVAETVLAMEHDGILEDYHTARRGW